MHPVLAHDTSQRAAAHTVFIIAAADVCVLPTWQAIGPHASASHVSKVRDSGGAGHTRVRHRSRRGDVPPARSTATPSTRCGPCDVGRQLRRHSARRHGRGKAALRPPHTYSHTTPGVPWPHTHTNQRARQRSSHLASDRGVPAGRPTQPDIFPASPSLCMKVIHKH